MCQTAVSSLRHFAGSSRPVPAVGDGQLPGISPAQAAQPSESQAICAHHRPVRLSWSRLLKRVWVEIDLEHYPNSAARNCVAVRCLDRRQQRGRHIAIGDEPAVPVIDFPRAKGRNSRSLQTPALDREVSKSHAADPRCPFGGVVGYGDQAQDRRPHRCRKRGAFESRTTFKCRISLRTESRDLRCARKNKKLAERHGTCAHSKGTCIVDSKARGVSAPSIR